MASEKTKKVLKEVGSIIGIMNPTSGISKISEKLWNSYKNRKKKNKNIDVYMSGTKTSTPQMILEGPGYGKGASMRFIEQKRIGRKTPITSI